MKRTAIYLFAAMTLISFSQCSKDSPQGPEGERGERGKQGEKGAKGDDGTSILSGKGSPSSSLGDVGDFYLDLSSSELYGPKTASGWGTAVSIQGEKGDRGATGAKGDKGDKGATGAKGQDGSQFLSGTSTPSSSLGNVGDFYFRTSTSVLYGPKTSSGWGSGTSLKGPKGDKGDPGNANVKKYTFSVGSDEWAEGTHYGNSNSHNYFTVASSLTGEIFMSNSKYVVLAYAKVNSSNLDYSEKKQLPYVFGIGNDYGLRFELLPLRSEIIMSKTLQGWDSKPVPLAQRPEKVDFEIVMVEVGVANKLKDTLDFGDYNAVAKYFNLD